MESYKEFIKPTKIIVLHKNLINKENLYYYLIMSKLYIGR